MGLSYVPPYEGGWLSEEETHSDLEDAINTYPVVNEQVSINNGFLKRAARTVSAWYNPVHFGILTMSGDQDEAVILAGIGDFVISGLQYCVSYTLAFNGHIEAAMAIFLGAGAFRSYIDNEIQRETNR